MATVGYHIVVLLSPMLLKIEKHRTGEECVLGTSIKPYLPADVAMIGGFRKLLLRSHLNYFKRPAPHWCSFESSATVSEHRL